MKKRKKPKRLKKRNLKNKGKQMAILRTKDIRKLSKKDLEKKLNELELELSKEKANTSVGATVVSPGRMNELKKTIARIKTIMKEKESEEAKHG